MTRVRVVWFALGTLFGAIVGFFAFIVAANYGIDLSLRLLYF